MKIELLYFTGCPHYEAFAPRLDALLAAHGSHVRVRHIEVNNVEQAQRLRFLGSPTVRVDGIDVDPSAVGRTDFGMQCRLYRAPTGMQGMPPDDLIIEALERSRRDIG